MNFKPVYIVLLALISTIVISTSCKRTDDSSSETTSENGSTATATSETLDISKVVFLEPVEFIKDSKKGSAVLIDIRLPQEFEKGHAEDAVNYSFFDGEFKNKLLSLDRDKKYYIYAKADSHSRMAAAFMNFNDFREVYALKGGYDAWVTNGGK